jgi:hypothetical protein
MRTPEEILRKPAYSGLTNLVLIADAMEEYASQYKEELSRLKGGWISVKDDQPEKEGPYLAVAMGWEPYVARFARGNWGIDGYPANPTHWQPLPPPPASKIEPSQSGKTICPKCEDKGQYQVGSLVTSMAQCECGANPYAKFTVKIESGNSESNLLPCPFCHSQPEWINEALADSHFYIRCPHCHIVMKEDRKDKVIGMWNTRKSPPLTPTDK